MNKSNRVILALDSDNFKKINSILDKIKNHLYAVKIGYEFFLNFGLDGYKKIKKKRIKIFLDLKLHDIPNTVKNGIEAISKLRAEFTTIHISGGDEMQKLAISKKGNTKILGVSILTSLDVDQIKKYYSKNKIKKLDKNFVKNAHKNNLDGVICSPKEIQIIRKLVNDKFIIITPGIRPINYKKKDDQQRTLTPKKAIELGANFIVIGRPILLSKDPLKEIRKINLEIEQSKN